MYNKDKNPKAGSKGKSIHKVSRKGKAAAKHVSTEGAMTQGGKIKRYKTLTPKEPVRLAKYESKESKAKKEAYNEGLKKVSGALGKIRASKVAKKELKERGISKAERKKYLTKGVSKTKKGFGRVKKLR